MARQKVITIDGPAGSGKSTTARMVASILRWQFVDTGAMYRALGLAVLRSGGDPTRIENVRPVLEQTSIELLPVIPVRVLLDGEDVTGEIRTNTVSSAASEVSVHGEVRERLVELQRAIGGSKPSVLEGRDTGTVVFPDAGLKVYLHADIQARAERRMKDYWEQGREVHLGDIVEEIVQRDQRDTTRTHSPLKIAEDAIMLDTTGLAINEQVERVVELARERFEL